MRHFLLVDHEAVEVDDIVEWAQLANKRFERLSAGLDDIWAVAFDQFEHCAVSTVFLGLDHNWTGAGAPVLFETAVFMGSDDLDPRGEGDGRVKVEARYSTWDEAVAGHARYADIYRIMSSKASK